MLIPGASVRLRLAPKKKHADAIMLVIAFGSLIVTILGLVIEIIMLTEDSKKDRR
ncbi:putative holin-like toxin [Lacticaseibacillus sp. GG6-2]